MNYRHIYHAGNFADVLKHVVLALAIEHLKQKPAPFRVIDTHAGIGLYDLMSLEAQKTGEWRQGIGRLLTADLPAPVREVMSPYLDVVRALNAEQPTAAASATETGTEPAQCTIARYPGSPLLARRLMRRGDRLVVNELHPEDASALRALFAGDPQAKVLEIDGWQALKALLPPKERRGVVLLDPPFEQAGDLERLTTGLDQACQRFATGTYLLWFPIKSTSVIGDFYRAVVALGWPKLLLAELMIRAPSDEQLLNGTGLLVLNPPFTLEAKLKVLLPFLATVMKQGAGASWRLQWLTPN